VQPTDGTPPTTTEPFDLDVIERELADVEVALDRLEAGTYWTCEVTGGELPDDLLETEPLTRRLPSAPSVP
jgi:RNA polymerase-binding transcription factor DksA